MIAEVPVRDPRLAQLMAPQPIPERVATGARWSEGPVWIAEHGCVLWSDIPNNRILRWSERDGMDTWRAGVEYTNGHARERDGSILHCSHGLRAIYRTAVDGTGQSIVVDRWRGKRLNSPNDVIVKSDGTIWFTDPPYGLIVPEEGHGGESEIGACHVFRFDPLNATLDSVADLPEHPNGLAFSPDERLLYVSDTSRALAGHGENHCIWVFDVNDDSALSGGRVFAEISPGVPDGLRIDTRGWLYVGAANGVQVLHPDGTLLGTILVPEVVGNLVFGGPDLDTLYITASTSLYRIKLATRGASACWPCADDRRR